MSPPLQRLSVQVRKNSKYFGLLGIAVMMWLPTSGAWTSFYSHGESYRYEIWIWLAKWVACISFLFCAIGAGLLIVYFCNARARMKALMEVCATEASLLEGKSPRSLLRRPMGILIVGLGSVGIVLALCAVIVLAANLIMAFTGMLESTSGVARTTTMIFISRRLCTASGLCSGIFWLSTEWATRRAVDR